MNHHQDCPDDQWRFEADCGCLLCDLWIEWFGGVDDEDAWWQYATEGDNR